MELNFNAEGSISSKWHISLVNGKKIPLEILSNINTKAIVKL